MKPKNLVSKNRDRSAAYDYNPTIAVVGLGYVGLPVALGFSKKYKVIGYDVKADRIHSLKQHVDTTNQVTSQSLIDASIEFTLDATRLHLCDVIIICVPTPLNEEREPDLSHLINASKTVGENMRRNTVIIYESTVFPGATEEVCIPILEKYSTLHCGQDFFVGYSPERINPGDTSHTFSTTAKIVAAQDKQTLDKIYALYQSVIDAEVFKASSIPVAEAAKLVENTQRDINIAFMNELSIIFRHLGLQTHEVLEAARTKWNFLPFNPGLVGGHCIGVDPYYFIYKAKQEGYTPELMTIARSVNDQMSTEVVSIVNRYIEEKGYNHNELKVGLLGLTFKEDVPDLRNSKSIEIGHKLQNDGLHVVAYDPIINQQELPEDFNLPIITKEDLINLDIIILAVSHQQFREMHDDDYTKLLQNNTGLIVDVKGLCTNRVLGESIEVISL